MSHLFISNTNKELLWEVLLDEKPVKTMNKDEKIMLYESFNNHRKTFYELEKNIPINPSSNANTTLVEMNKRFLTSYIQILNSTKIESETNNQNINYKIEDIHAERQQIFEKQLAEKRQDFENIQLKPPPIDFSEKIEDTKIKGMDELIAKTIAQRNYEISQIHNSAYNKELFTNPNPNSNQNVIQGQPFKQIKIENIVPVKHEVINLHPEKKISWNETNEIKYFNKNDILIDKKENETPILNKLKKITSITSNIEELDKNIDKDILKKIHILTLGIKDEISEYKQLVENINRKLDIILKNKK